MKKENGFGIHIKNGRIQYDRTGRGYGSATGRMPVSSVQLPGKSVEQSQTLHFLAGPDKSMPKKKKQRKKKRQYGTGVWK